MTRRLALAPFLFALSACSAFGQVVDPAAERELPRPVVPPAQAGVAYQRFIVFGDHGTGSRDQRRVGEVMTARAAQDGVDFVLTTGDNFYPRGVRSADDPQWRTKFEEVYPDALRALPWYPTLGNHDHGGVIQAQIDYGETHPSWRLPARYHTFTRPLGQGEVVQFFALDTTPLGRAVDQEQVDWLAAALEASEARWKIVYGHHPLYSHSKRAYNLFLIARLEQLLVRHGVDLYVAGHDHTLEMLRPVKGVHHLVSGAGGGPSKAYKVRWTDKAYYAATLGGFVLARVGRSELVLEFVRMDGATEYCHVLTKGRAGPF